MDNIKSKLTSRKFWVAVAAMLASVAEGIAAYFAGNETLMTVSAVCFIVSAAVYQFCEAYVDGAGAASSTVNVVADLSKATAVKAIGLGEDKASGAE